MTMDSSRLLFFISPIVIHLVRITIARPDFLYYFCLDKGNYTSNSTYQANLNSVFSSISSNNEIDYGFYNFSAGQNTDKVNAIALCRGDVTPDKCRSCVNDSSHELTERCPYQKEAIGWYDNCMLRYSNRSIFGTAESDPDFFMWNVKNVSDVDQFNEVLGTLLANLRSQAKSGDSHRKFATGESNVTSFQRIYALLQCTPDLSALRCDNCLDGAINDIPRCCGGKQGGRVVRPSCNIRYATYPFYESTAAAPPATPPANNLPPPPTNATTTEDNRSSTSRTVVIIVVPTIILLIIAGLTCAYFLMMKPKEDVKNEDRNKESLRFDLGTIRAATNDFSDDNKLGQGGFGSVYKGRLSDGQEIAVKRLAQCSAQGELEFKNEIVLMAGLQHRNLVRLLGFCLEGRERLLIYEFIHNTSLDRFIFDPIKRVQLDWERRYKIIGGIARGILYLHEDSRLKIIHRDLKAGNVLLDREMNPKISDFGMARLFVVDQSRSNTRRIVGTYGYMAPEYANHGQISVKTDVFSFGVLILEIVSGKKNGFVHDSGNVEHLLSYAWKIWREGRALNLMDPILRGSSTSEIMRCIHIGLLCGQENVANRPTMASVVLMLNSYSLSLPSPSQPAFFMHGNMEPDTPLLEHISGVTESNQPPRHSGHLSLNEDSISEMYPR